MRLRYVIAVALLLHGLGAWAQGNPLPGEKGTITVRTCGEAWNSYITIKWDSGAVSKYFCFDHVRNSHLVGVRVVNDGGPPLYTPSVASAKPSPAPVAPAPAAPAAKIGTIDAVKVTIKLSDGSTVELPLKDRFPIRIGDKVEVVGGGMLKVLP